MLKLQQKDVARQIGVNGCTVFDWEANTSQPGLRFMPAVIRFLGYSPPSSAKKPGEQLVRDRTAFRAMQKDAARDWRGSGHAGTVGGHQRASSPCAPSVSGRRRTRCVRRTPRDAVIPPNAPSLFAISKDRSAPSTLPSGGAHSGLAGHEEAFRKSPVSRIVDRARRVGPLAPSPTLLPKLKTALPKTEREQ